MQRDDLQREDYPSEGLQLEDCQSEEGLSKDRPHPSEPDRFEPNQFEPHQPGSPPSEQAKPVRQAVAEVRLAAQQLQHCQGRQRSYGLSCMAAALEAAKDEILEANTLDLEASQDMAVPALVQSWLKLTPERLQAAIEILRELARVPDPLGQLSPAAYQPTAAQAYGQRFPLGVITLISEAFPALGAIAAGLCLRTANGLLLRGGSETSHSNQAIFSSLGQALEQAELPVESALLLPTDQGGSVQEFLEYQEGIDLIVPYGRASLVQQVIKGAVVPVIYPGLGNCYLYWSNSASFELVRWMLLESHRGEPDRVNALETVLLPPTFSTTNLERLWQDLRQQGVEIRGDETLQVTYPDLTPASAAEWGKSHWSSHPVVAFRVVADLSEAIALINTHSSGHANALATASYDESRQFSRNIRSAAVYINASPRFERYPGQGATVALGMACGSRWMSRGGFQGRIGLEMLTRTSQVVLG